MTNFYDELAPFYHLVYKDWNASVHRQGEQLSALIKAEWPSSRKILDVSCGMGTQAIGLAMQGYSVSASDLSEKLIKRAKREAHSRNVEVSFSVCDMRKAHVHHGSGFDVVVSGDNSLPHLVTDEDILLALKQMTACLSEGGGCVITVRDYELEERGRNLVKPYRVRMANGYRYLLFQVWDFEGEHYDLILPCRREPCNSGGQDTCDAIKILRNLSEQALRPHARGWTPERPASGRRFFFSPCWLGQRPPDQAAARR